MADIAALNLAIDSSSVKQASVELQTLGTKATAAEKAAERWGLSTKEAARSTEDFSRRVQGTIKQLEFERAQLTRTTAEQEKYAAVRRAGVAASSAEGKAIMASVAALQAQKAAATSTGNVIAKTAASASSAVGGLVSQLKGLALAYISVQAAQELWNSAMSAGDLGEQAEQVGLTTDQLQAYRLAGAQAGVSAESLDTAIVKLVKTMGAANDGSKEAIALFDSVGVKILDASGKMRPAADVLPELSRGLLAIGSDSERLAKQTEFLGKGGAKVTTMLAEWTKGNEALIDSARKENALISPATIAAWDTLGDKMLVTKQVWNVLIAELGAKYAIPFLDDLKKALETTRQELEAVATLWRWLVGNVNAAKREAIRASVAAPADADAKNLRDTLEAQRGLLAINPNNQGVQASVKALEGRLAVFETAAKQATMRANQAVFEFDEALARGGDPVPATLTSGMGPAATAPTGSRGASNPVAKASGGGGKSDPYKDAIEGARDYIAAKNAETAAVGLSVEAAARMTHEQALMNKLTKEGTVLLPAQVAMIQKAAQAMAAADAQFKIAKFMDDAVTKSKEFIAAQEIEQATLFMSAEAAMAYRLEKELLNQATAQGITLTAEQTAKIREGASAQAAAAEKTRQLTEIIEFGKDAARGFFNDFAQGLRDGLSLTDALGNAMMNMLNKVADKLMQMAVDDLVGQAFGGGKGGSGGGGGFLGSLLGGLFGGGSSSVIGGGSVASPSFLQGTYANGAAFRNGVVSRPTLFAMKNGSGLMGEAGPEAVMPLRQGKSGRLGVDASGVGATVVNIHNYAEGSKATAQQSKGSNGAIQIDVIVEAVEGKMSGRVARGQGSFGKTIEGTYGLQRVGR